MTLGMQSIRSLNADAFWMATENEFAAIYDQDHAGIIAPYVWLSKLFLRSEND